MNIFAPITKAIDNVILRKVITILFEQIPILKKLNGYKTKIGASFICLYYTWKAVYPVLAQYFPEAIPMLGSFDMMMGYYIQFVADAFVVFGVQHQIIKTAREERNYDYQQRLYS